MPFPIINRNHAFFQRYTSTMHSWRRWVSTSQHLSMTSTGASLFTTRCAGTYSLLPTDTSFAREQRRKHRFPRWSLQQNEAFKPITIVKSAHGQNLRWTLPVRNYDFGLWTRLQDVDDVSGQNWLWKVCMFLSFFTLVSLVQFRRSIFNMIFILGFRYYLKNTPSVLMIGFLRRWR